MNQNQSPEPWYAPSGKKKPVTPQSSMLPPEKAPSSVRIAVSIFSQLLRLKTFLFSTLVMSVCVYLGARLSTTGGSQILAGLLMAAGVSSAFLILFRFWGAQLSALLPHCAGESPFAVAVKWSRGELSAVEARRGPPAPELALAQFVSQVRAYASEKSFQNVRPHSDRVQPDSDTAHLLRRRWNEVVDSLDEFEIYLANDPQGMISKLVSKNPPKQIDAAVVFREVAETFDTTWRRKGINIESAIVTPLKATAHEGLLRRLLVGPWRASAYFARRGSSVVFSAKSVQGRVVARWEVDGLSLPEEYLPIAKDSAVSVNDRIEKGLSAIAPDPANSPNTLYALISLVTWIDLAHACETEFEVKNNSNGFVIEIRLR